ncbi:MAG: HVO_A0114 family putative DNA-binding protein [Devosia sp.]
MTTVAIGVKPLEQSQKEVRELLASGRSDPTPRINFVNWDLFHKMLAPNRMAIIQAMTGAGPLSIREVARRVERDFKGVHSDVTALLKGGFINRTDDGRVVFPYDRIRFDFEIPPAEFSPAA